MGPSGHHKGHDFEMFVIVETDSSIKDGGEGTEPPDFMRPDPKDLGCMREGGHTGGTGME